MKLFILKRISYNFLKYSLLFIFATWSAFASVLIQLKLPLINKAMYVCGKMPLPFPEYLAHIFDSALILFSFVLPVIYFIYFLKKKNWRVFSEFIIIATLLLCSVMLVEFSKGSEDTCLAWPQRDRLLTYGVQQQLEIYFQDCGRYPSEEQGLNALVTTPEKSPLCKKWQGPYIKRVENDKYGRPLLYQLTNGQGKVTALGRDGQVGGTGKNEDYTSKDPLL